MKAFTESFMVRRCLVGKLFTHSRGLIHSCRGLPRCDEGRGVNDSLRLLLSSALLFVITGFAPFSQAQDAFLHHDLKVVLSPAEHSLEVLDLVTLPNEFQNKLTFSLHAGLKPTSPTPGVRIMKLAEKRGPSRWYCLTSSFHSACGRSRSRTTASFTIPSIITERNRRAGFKRRRASSPLKAWSCPGPPHGILILDQDW